MGLGGRCYHYATNVRVRERASEIVLNSNIRKLLRYSLERRMARVANHPERAKLVKIPDVIDAPIAGADHHNLFHRFSVGFWIHCAPVLVPQRKQNCAVAGKEAWQLGHTAAGSPTGGESLTGAGP